MVRLVRGAIVAALTVLLVPAPTLAQEMAGRVWDTAGEVLDLEYRTLDLLLEELEVSGQTQQLAVAETDTEIRIELAADILFDFDRSDIRDEAAVALGQLAELIRGHPGRPVRIEGHTDSKGPDAYNQALSEDRALAVMDWLADNAGLDTGNFDIVGYGESRPAAPNEQPDGSDSPDGRQKNRRVEVVIKK